MQTAHMTAWFHQHISCCKSPCETDRLMVNTPVPVAAGDTNDNKTAVGPEDVSKMGCPCLGEHTKLEVVIEESYEFKVTHNKQLFTSEPPTTLMFAHFGTSQKTMNAAFLFVL